MRNLYPLEVNEGEDKTFQIDLSRLDLSEYDLTGCTITAEIRDVLHQLVLKMTPAIVTPATGLFNLSVARADTIGKAGRYLWDLRIQSPLGNDYLEGGTFKIWRSATDVSFANLGMDVTAISTMFATL